MKLGCEVADPNRFSGQIDIQRHEILSISSVHGNAHRVERRPADIKASCEHHFLFSLQLSGTSEVTQFGQVALLRPGDMALYYSVEPYALKLDEGHAQMVLQVPAERLLARLPNVVALVARRVDGGAGLGRLVKENLAAFSAHMTSENAAVRKSIQETLVDMVATGLSELSAGTVELSLPEQHILLRVKSMVAGSLADPDLDRTVIAERMGMSVRRLNAIFGKQGTSLGEIIRTTRLDAVKRDLRNASLARLSISEIAYRNGYSNMQNFSTLFKNQEGVNPRDYRRTHLG